MSHVLTPVHFVSLEVQMFGKASTLFQWSVAGSATSSRIALKFFGG